MSRTARPQLSRRAFLAGAGAMAATVVSACSSSSSGGSASAGSVTAGSGAAGKDVVDVSDTDRVVRWADRPLDLDRDATTQKFPTLDAFESTTGITPTYYQEIDDDALYLESIEARLAAGVDIGRDVVTLADWAAGRLIEKGWAQPLDTAKYVPNAANILPRLRTVAFDPGRHHSLTWQSGFTGLAWNVTKLRDLTGKTALTSVDELWDSRLAGRVEVLSEMRETIGILLRSAGVDPSGAFPDSAFTTAVAQLRTHLSGGQIRQVAGSGYADDLASGDAVAVIGRSGDIAQLNARARDASPSLTADPFAFAMPASGGMLWSTNLLIPVATTHRQNAEALMNYYYDPQVAARVAISVGYVCPVAGAQDAVRHLDPALAASPLIFPTQAELDAAAVFRTLSDAEDAAFTAAFRSAIGS